MGMKKTAKKNGAVTKAKAPKKLGRPTVFTPKVGETICARMCDGESLREICLDEKMPTRSSVHLWLVQAKGEDPAPGLKIFSDQYKEAVEVRAENMFDELEGIADDGQNDWMEKEAKDGSSYTVLDHEHVQRSRLRIDTRKWKLSKMLPKRFGERSTITTEDEEGNTVPIQGNIIQFASQKDEPNS